MAEPEYSADPRVDGGSAGRARGRGRGRGGRGGGGGRRGKGRGNGRGGADGGAGGGTASETSVSLPAPTREDPRGAKDTAGLKSDAEAKAEKQEAAAELKKAQDAAKATAVDAKTASEQNKAIVSKGREKQIQAMPGSAASEEAKMTANPAVRKSQRRRRGKEVIADAGVPIPQTSAAPAPVASPAQIKTLLDISRNQVHSDEDEQASFGRYRKAKVPPSAMAQAIRLLSSPGLAQKMSGEPGSVRAELEAAQKKDAEPEEPVNVPHSNNAILALQYLMERIPPRRQTQVFVAMRRMFPPTERMTGPRPSFAPEDRRSVEFKVHCFLGNHKLAGKKFPPLRCFSVHIGEQALNAMPDVIDAATAAGRKMDIEGIFRHASVRFDGQNVVSGETGWRARMVSYREASTDSKWGQTPTGRNYEYDMRCLATAVKLKRFADLKEKQMDRPKHILLSDEIAGIKRAAEEIKSIAARGYASLSTAEAASAYASRQSEYAFHKRYIESTMALARERSEQARRDYEQAQSSRTKSAAETFSKKNEDDGNTSEESVLHMEPLSILTAIEDAPVINEKKGGAVAELDAFRAKTALRIDGCAVIDSSSSASNANGSGATPFEVALWKQSPVLAPGKFTTLTDWREHTEALRAALGKNMSVEELHQIAKQNACFDWDRAIMEHIALAERMSNGKSLEEKTRNYRYITIAVDKRLEQFMPNTSSKADDELRELDTLVANALEIGERAFAGPGPAAQAAGAGAGAATAAAAVDALDAKDAKTAERVRMSSGSEPERKVDPLGHIGVAAAGPILALDYAAQLEASKDKRIMAQRAVSAAVGGSDHKDLPPVEDKDGFVDDATGKTIKSWDDFRAARYRLSKDGEALLTLNREKLYWTARVWAAKATQFNLATKVKTACIELYTNSETTVLPNTGSQSFDLTVRLGVHITCPVIDRAEARARQDAAVLATVSVIQSENDMAARAKAGSIATIAQDLAARSVAAPV